MTIHTPFVWAIFSTLISYTFASADTVAAETVDPGSQAACAQSQPGTIPQTLEGSSLATTVLVQLTQSTLGDIALGSLPAQDDQIGADPATQILPNNYAN